jgi:hypothetical protein
MTTHFHFGTSDAVGIQGGRSRFYPPLISAQRLRTGGVHYISQFAKLSVHEGLQDQIAPVHSDFSCGLRRCP